MVATDITLPSLLTHRSGPIKVRPDFGTTPATCRSDETRLKVGRPVRAPVVRNTLYGDGTGENRARIAHEKEKRLLRGRRQPKTNPPRAAKMERAELPVATSR
jgi:hypothetical protein